MKIFAKILGVIVALLLVAFLFLRVSDTDPAQMRAKYGAEPSQFVELPNGQTVHLRDEGPVDGATDAPAIILLHGSNADLHTWQPWVDRLKQDYRIIRYDQIGHGLTGPAVEGGYSASEFGRDVEAVADHLELDSFILAGNSMGGWIAASYAMEHPERLKGLVLVDAGGAPVKRDEDGGNIGFTIAATPGLRQIMTQITPRSIIKQSLEQSVSVQSVATEEAVDRYWELLRYPGNRAATIERFSGTRMAFEEGDISAITVPTLIMWGTEDALIPVEAGRWFDKALPNSTLIEYDGIGHLPHEEMPQRSADDLKAWLAGLAPDDPAQTASTE